MDQFESQRGLERVGGRGLEEKNEREEMMYASVNSKCIKIKNILLKY